MDDHITGLGLAPIIHFIERNFRSQYLEDLIKRGSVEDFLIGDGRYREVGKSRSIDDIIAACKDKSKWFSVELERSMIRAATEIANNQGYQLSENEVAFSIGYYAAELMLNRVAIQANTKGVDPGGYLRRIPELARANNFVWEWYRGIERNGITEPDFHDLVGDLGLEDTITFSEIVDSDAPTDLRSLKIPRENSRVSSNLWKHLNGFYHHYLRQAGTRLDFVQLDVEKYNPNVSFSILNHYYALGLLAGVTLPLKDMPNVTIAQIKEPSEDDSSASYGFFYMSRDTSRGFIPRHLTSRAAYSIYSAFDSLRQRLPGPRKLEQAREQTRDAYRNLGELAREFTPQLMDLQESKRDLEGKLEAARRETRETERQLAVERALRQRLDATRVAGHVFNNSMQDIIFILELILSQEGIITGNQVYSTIVELAKSAGPDIHTVAAFNSLAAVYSPSNPETRTFEQTIDDAIGVYEGHLGIYGINIERKMARVPTPENYNKNMWLAHVLGLQNSLEAIVEEIDRSLPDDKTQHRILYETYQEDDKICSRLHDTGIGFTQEAIKQFGKEEFTTKDPPHKGGGSMLIAEILRESNGRFTVGESPYKDEGYKSSLTFVLDLGEAK